MACLWICQWLLSCPCFSSFRSRMLVFLSGKKMLLSYLKHRYLIYSPLFNSSGNLSNFLSCRTWRPAEPQVEAVQVSWGLLGPMGSQAMAVFPGLTHKGCSATPVCAVLPHETPRSNLDSLMQVHRCPERPKLSQSPPKKLLLLITNRLYCLIKIQSLNKHSHFSFVVFTSNSYSSRIQEK